TASSRSRAQISTPTSSIPSTATSRRTFPRRSSRFLKTNKAHKGMLTHALVHEKGGNDELVALAARRADPRHLGADAARRATVPGRVQARRRLLREHAHQRDLG